MNMTIYNLLKKLKEEYTDDNFNLLKKELKYIPPHLDLIIFDIDNIDNLYDIVINYKPISYNPYSDKESLIDIFFQITNIDDFDDTLSLHIPVEVLSKSFKLDTDLIFGFLLTFGEDYSYTKDESIEFFNLFYSFWEEGEEYLKNKIEEKSEEIEFEEEIIEEPVLNRKDSILKLIELCRTFNHLWYEYEYQLKKLVDFLHPDFYDLSQSCIPTKDIYGIIIDYKPLNLNPIKDKDKLEKLYNDLLEANEEEYSSNIIIETIENSFGSFNTDYIYYPEEIQKNRKEVFSFEEVYQLWLNKKL